MCCSVAPLPRCPTGARVCCSVAPLPRCPAARRYRDTNSFVKDYKFDSSVFVYYGLSLLGLPGIFTMLLYGSYRNRVLGAVAMYSKSHN